MTNVGSDSERFEALSRELLNEGLCVRFEARGASMSPCIRDGEIVHVTPVIVSELRKDDIVLTKSNNGFRVHRLVVADHAKDFFITRGDCGQQDDPAVRGEEILGVAVAKEVKVGRRMVRANIKGAGGHWLRGAARAQAILTKVTSAALAVCGRSRQSSGKYLGLLGLLLVLVAVPYSVGQVAVDATTSRARERTGPGTVTNLFAHTTSAAANRLLIVGVSMNISTAPTTAVTGVTYNGTALIFLGAHNDTANTRRVEMWYLLNPVSGNNLAVNVSVNIPVAGATVGIVAGATTFTGVDQTVPLSAFISANGANGANSQLDVPSVVNGMILDTLSTGGDQAVAVPGPQVSRWNLTTVSGTDPPAVTATGSTRAGAPSVPISETFSGTSNWSLGAVSINPTAADIGVSTSVGSAVILGQNSTYNIIVTNSGFSPANNVVLTDTWAAAGLTLVSVTPSAGTTCAGTAPISCTLPTPFASGATATVAVVVTASASGAYPNTATVTDSGTPPDPSTGNNTYIAVATVQSVSCASVVQAGPGGTLTSVVNTYYPGTANVAAGATSIPVGAATGAGTAIAAGNLLLVIQMQDASINDSNAVTYGNGSTGQGFTAVNSAGSYEFVTATGPIAAGSVPIAGAGTGGGLVFAYKSAAASATKGRSTYQVVLVPQYTTATLGASLTASPWNGITGGVLALDASGTLSLGGVTVSVDGTGFRGGAGLQLNGGVGGANRLPSRCACNLRRHR